MRDFFNFKRLIKPLIALVIIAVLAVGFFIGRDIYYKKTGVVATVNGETIYKSDIEKTINFQKASEKAAKDVDGYDFQGKVTGKKQTLKDLIRRKVIMQQAEKEDVLEPLSKSRASIRESFAYFKENNQTAYAYHNKVKEHLGMTEEEYIEYSANVQCVSDSYDNLYDKYKLKHEEIKTDDMSDSFVKWLDGEVKSANVKYYDKSYK